MHDFIWEGEIDLQICDDIYNFYDNCTYLKKRVYQSNPFNDAKGNGKDSTDIHCHTMLAQNEVVLDNYLKALLVCIDDYFRIYPQAGQMDCHISPLFNIQRYKPNQCYWKPHCENDGDNLDRLLAWTFYLNTVTDGGGTRYTQYDRTVDAVEGRLVIWPA